MKKTCKTKKSLTSAKLSDTLPTSGTMVLGNMNFAISSNLNFDSSDSNSNNDTLDAKERIASRVAFLNKVINLIKVSF